MDNPVLWVVVGVVGVLLLISCFAASAANEVHAAVEGFDAGGRSAARLAWGA